MKRKTVIIWTVLIGIFILSANCVALAQHDNTAAFAAANTNHFSVNKAEGWNLYNSYVSRQGNDSVRLEVIIQNDRNIDLHLEQLVGYISNQSLLPKSRQVIGFNLVNNFYQLKIEPNGDCYLSLISSKQLSKNYLIIPVNIFYRLKA